MVDDGRLAALVQVLNNPDYRLGLDDVEPDMIGRAYEYLLRKFAEGQGQSAGEFYMPREVAVLMAIILDPQPGLTSIVSRKPVMMNPTHAAHPTHAGRQADTRSASELGGHTQHTLHTLHTNPIGSLFVSLTTRSLRRNATHAAHATQPDRPASYLTLNFDSPMTLPRLAMVVEGHHSRQKPPAAP